MCTVRHHNYAPCSPWVKKFAHLCVIDRTPNIQQIWTTLASNSYSYLNKQPMAVALSWYKLQGNCLGGGIVWQLANIEIPCRVTSVCAERNFAKVFVITQMRNLVWQTAARVNRSSFSDKCQKTWWWLQSVFSLTVISYFNTTVFERSCTCMKWHLRECNIILGVGRFSLAWKQLCR